MDSRKNVASLALAVVALAISGAPAAGQELPPELREAIELRIDRGFMSGVIVGLITAEGREVYEFGAVRDGGPPPDAATVFEIGSISKAFTGVILADMVLRGELSLDDPIESLLPPEVEVPTRDGRSITLGDLASHVSALPRLPGNMAMADPTNPYADYSVEQLYQFLGSWRLARDIGERYEYSNLGAGLLGHLLALRAGMSYEQLLWERITDPLGMEDTRIELTPSLIEHVAQGHSGVLEVSGWDIPTLAGAGGIRSTAEDMMTFVAANMGLIETGLLPAMRMANDGRHAAGPGMEVGLGWHIRTTGDTDIIWHNGGTGGYRSFAGFTADGALGVVLLSNSDYDPDDLALRVLDPESPLRQPPATVRVDPGALERYVGRYRFSPTVELDVGLTAGHLTVQLTGQQPFTMYPESETEFFLTVVQARLVFEEEDGEVTAAVLHQGGTEQRAERID